MKLLNGVIPASGCCGGMVFGCYENDNFPTVNATYILFSPFHTTPFLYSKMHFGVLDYIPTFQV